MYEKRFGLHRKPFQVVQNQNDYFCSEAYRELLPTVLNALQSDLGVAVLTGPAGVGKSVTLESFRRSLEPNAQTLFVRGGAVRNADELLYSLHRHLLKTQKGGDGQDSRAVVRRWDVIERLQRLSEFWGPLTILVDDVHLVEVDVFSELRSLLEEEADGQKLVRLLIAGPLMLEEVLAQPTMGDFAQKIRTHVFLEPLRTSESVDYLAHHISNAGGELHDLFDSPAVEKIIVAADGMPRCLNLLADESLMICEETKSNRVTADIVNAALKRLLHLPVTWNASLDRDEVDSEDDIYDPDDSATHSVVEIGGGVEEISHGVIEFGAPANEAERRKPRDIAQQKFTGATSKSTIDLDSDICEFVAEDEICRDNGLIEDIAGISDAITSIDAMDMQFDFCSDLEDSIEISQEEFFSEVAQEAVGDAAAVNEEDVGQTTHSGDSNVDYEVMPSVADELSETICSGLNVASIDDFERHLLLAGTDSSDAETQCGDDVCSETEEAEFENEHLFAAILSKANPMDAYEEQFSSYTRWEPSGAWPPVIAEQTTEVPTYASQLGNASPVFDRYTWCELGRTVSAEPISRRNLAPTPLTETDWPPSLVGISPELSIPIEDACQDDNGLLPDLATVIGRNSSYTNPADQIESTSIHYSVGESLTLSDLSMNKHAKDDPSPDGNYDNFFEPQTSEYPALSDSASVERDDLLPDLTLVADEGQQTISLPMDMQEGPALSAPVEIDTAEPERHQPIDHPAGSVQEGSGNDDSKNTLDDTTDVAALIANVVQRYISDNESPNRIAHSVSQNTPASSSNGESLLIIDDETSNKSITEYAPKLLQEARSRVVSVLAAQGQLKQAAGAENTPFPARRTDNEQVAERPHLSISRQFDDTPQNEDTSAAEPRTAAPRFRDLFTRLRKLKGKSA